MTEITERGHGSHIITALERAWSAIRANHPDVPRVVAITGQGQSGLDMTWGHFDPESWNVGERATPELFISGELIAMGGRRVMQTLLHEAAHGIAHTRDIKDTSNKNRYHNKQFAKLATEVGLQPPAASEPVLGWSDCRITDATAERYADLIAAIEAERLPYRNSAYVTYLRNYGEDDDVADTGNEDGQTRVLPGDDHDAEESLDPAAAPAGRDGRRVPVACACVPPRRLQVTPAVFERGPISCGPCGTDFVHAEPARPRRRRAPREL